MKKITVREHQTTWDIAIQEYGSVEGFFLVMDDNPEIFTNLNVLLQPGMILRVRDVVINKTVVDYYKNNHVIPVSGLSVALLQYTFNGGGFDDAFNVGFDTLPGDEGGAFSDGFDNGYLIF